MHAHINFIHLREIISGRKEKKTKKKRREKTPSQALILGRI